MFCGKCGFKNEDGVKFCSKCGSPLEAENAQSQATEQTGTPTGQVYSQPAASQPTKKRNINLIAIAAVILVAIIAIGLVLNSAALSNFVKKATSSDEEYLAYVSKKSTDELASDISSIIEKADTENYSGAGRGGLSVELGEAGIEFLESVSGEDLDWVKKAIIEFGYNVKDEKSAITATLKFNDISITSAEAIIDVENQMIYMRLPDLDEQYISVSMEDMGMSVLYGDMSSVAEYLPSAKETEALIKRYLDIVYDCIEDVEKEGDTVSVNGVSEKCDKYTIKIDNKFLVNVTKAVLEEAKDDKDLEKIIKNFISANYPQDEPDELYEEMISGIDTALEELDEDELTDVEADLATWINNKGEVVGLEFRVPEATISYLAPEDGKKFALELKVIADGGSVSLEGEGKISGNKKSGEFSVNVMGIELVDITVTDLNTKKLEDGYLNGTIEIAPSSGLSSMLFGTSSSSDLDPEAFSVVNLISKLKVKIDMESSKKKADYTISVLIDSEEWATIGIFGEETKAKKIEIPSDSIDATDSDAIEEWASSIDLEKIISKLEEAGVPSELLEEFDGFGASEVTVETMAPAW